MRILNLYCGIGGNRKLWGPEHKVTAVELDPDIAKIYKDLYPQDEVITGDAHQYLIPDTGRAREKVRNDKGQTLKVKMEQQGIFIENFYNYKRDKRTLLNNCIEPELGQHILKQIES